MACRPVSCSRCRHGAQPVAAPGAEAFLLPPPLLARAPRPAARAADGAAAWPGAIFLDVGANIGLYSLIAARLVGPDGAVIAFEPLAELAETLRRSARLQGFSHLRCIELALSDRREHAVFHRARDGSANSLVPETEARVTRYCGSLEVPVDTLDAYLAGAAVDPRRIGLIKIDVEGEETRTVAGMLDTLRAAAFPPVWVEVRGTRASTRAPNTYPLVRQLLAGLEYEPYNWNGVERRPLGDQLIVGREDVLFMPRRSEWV